MRNTILAALFAGLIALAQSPKSVWDGIYTDEQAAQGAALYQQQCASCHGGDLEGKGQAPALAGDEFNGNWEGQSLGDLFEKMQETMPADRPGSLTPEQNAQILACMLKTGKIPSGSTALKGDATALKPVLFHAKKP